jgi:hypothetical protein
VPNVAAPYLSVMVELDNILHSTIDRARTMLVRLLDQLRQNELEPRAEILVTYDETAVSLTDVHRIVSPTVMAEYPFIQFVATRGLRYFSLKNEGARRAKGEILLFVDSDCLPEDGWLRELLQPFRDSEIDIVTGNSYIDRDTFYAKTFALGWYFPPRLPDGPLVRTRVTYVNTLAMRRRIFERYPFPDVTTLYMGQGVTWNRTLAENGVPIFLNPRARVAHPPPVFLRSAIVNGYDTAQRTRKPGDSKLLSLKIVGSNFRNNIGAMVRRIRLGHREVGLSRASVPFAVALAGTYWSLWSLFELIARWAPRLIPHQHLR